ncbi:la protein 1 [Silene latifolia]|uniref:la protein 1 n=1 Tax=Silene latifolia TaxID=37657 RepID=UPI003D7828A3
MATKTSCLDEETVKKVIRQVEFYFSDSNLPRDNFLRTTISETQDGMVSLPLICSFSRMRTHLGLGDVKADGVPEATVQAVAHTLRTSDFLKISDDGKKVGRKTELVKPEEVIEQIDTRTVAASPLPYDVKLEDVEALFTQHGKVNSVRLPKHVSNNKMFCGTALVEFSSEEDAEKLLKQTLAYAGADLELRPKKDFDAEREKQTEEYEKTRGQGNRKAPEEPSYTKGLIVAFKLKSKSSGGDSKQNGAQEHLSEMEASKTDGETATNAADQESENPKDDSEGIKEIASDESIPNKEVKEGEDSEKSSESAEKKDGEKVVEAKTTMASYKDNMDVVIREDLKALFEKFGTVKYIDFKMGEESGYIRFDEPEASQKARAVAVLNDEGGLVVKNFIAILEPVSGDAEKEYWSQIQGNQKSYKGNRGRGGRFNRGGGRHGRSRDNRSSPAGRPNKVQKITA